ncbi:MAG: hypothetical protein AAF429_15855 [Pseudomonadota bacterium]
MTALEKYQRLEAAGLWRASPTAQRVDVIISVGDATLTISDGADRPLTHWSLAAVERSNPGQRPAVYFPNGDPSETLEIATNDADMIDAIEKLRRAVGRGRPHPGRLRLMTFLVSIAAVVALLMIWLPGALRNHAISVVPDVKRTEIGAALREEMERVTGAACTSQGGQEALERLATRLPTQMGQGRFDVVRNGVAGAIALPGGTILLGRSLVEDHDEPDVLAGYVVAEHVRAVMSDPLEDMLMHGSAFEVVQLLTTGDLPESTLARYAEHLLTTPRPALSNEALLNGFRSWSVRARPYAYAEDVTGESTLALIEADPYANAPPPPILSDADWLRLQGICGA